MGVFVICPDCGKRVAGRVPRGGDGSAWYPRFHRVGLKPCGGRFATVWEEAPDPAESGALSPSEASAGNQATDEQKPPHNPTGEGTP